MLSFFYYIKKHRLRVKIVQLRKLHPTVIFEEQDVQASMLVTGRDRS
ncbi:hypothetical protein ACFOU2_25085 [Bacillus songklensis]|uniref:Uncharacterized protein n=1 Tax=Bacillus songklensis TaxID=1069116 RepID=A0ABV8B8I3_9BACI